MLTATGLLLLSDAGRRRRRPCRWEGAPNALFSTAIPGGSVPYYQKEQQNSTTARMKGLYDMPCSMEPVQTPNSCFQENGQNVTIVVLDWVTVVKILLDGFGTIHFVADRLQYRAKLSFDLLSLWLIVMAFF